MQVPCCQLLVMSIVEHHEAWDRLCPFLGFPFPNEHTFPYYDPRNPKSRYDLVGVTVNNCLLVLQFCMMQLLLVGVTVNNFRVRLRTCSKNLCVESTMELWWALGGTWSIADHAPPLTAPPPSLYLWLIRFRTVETDSSGHAANPISKNAATKEPLSHGAVLKNKDPPTKPVAPLAPSRLVS